MEKWDPRQARPVVMVGARSEIPHGTGIRLNH
jgi:hypothetical protein